MTHGDERRILDQCAPAIAGVKSGSLLKIDRMVCNDAVELLSSFGNKDVGTKVLCSSGSFLLVLVFRYGMMDDVLSAADVSGYLRSLGYSGTFDDMIDQLAYRMQKGIQHELGIFLGYPLCDVIGFVENNGKNYKLSGCWKVYGDECAARKMFERIKRSRADSLRMFDQGMSFRTVACAL